MLERFHDISDHITIVLSRVKKCNFALSSEELSVIPDIMKALKPFFELTEAMSTEREPTINVVVPYCTSLLKELESMTAVTSAGKMFVTYLMKQAKKRLLPYETTFITQYVLNYTYILLMIKFMIKKLHFFCTVLPLF